LRYRVCSVPSYSLHTVGVVYGKDDNGTDRGEDRII